MEKTRICAFGDSALKGTVLESGTPLRYTLPNKTFTDLAAEELGVGIDNFARFGSTIASAGKMLIRHCTQLPLYDVALLKFGGNDCDFYWQAIAADPNRHHDPNVPLTEFSLLYEKLLDSIRAAGPMPVMLTMLPLDPERYFAHITRDFSPEGRANVLEWLGGTPEFIAQWHDMYSLQVRGLASRFDVPLIDIAAPLTESGNAAEFLCEDGIHPNLRGQKLMAGALASALERILGDRIPASSMQQRLAFC
ncbi:MAG: SGNH/GDSL hydrolase family protein [Bacteroidales bacterium]|nr:SGNH/GDSL hydrolase family protein [Bacteroidales bacterium]